MSAALSHAAPLPAPAPAPLRPARAPRLRSTSPQLLLVANANASGLAGNSERVAAAAAALRRHGGRVETRLTATLEELAGVVTEESRRLVVLGGDGSVHAAANIAGGDTELALLPAGKANNLAHGLGVPVDLDAAARLAVAGEARRIDLIAARSGEHQTLAVEGVSVGYHAIARSQYRAANSADLAAGTRAALGALASFRPFPLVIESDGRAEIMTVGQLFAANFPLYGPGLRVAPGADPTDGLLDLVAIDAPGRASLLATLARLRRGTHIGRPGVRHWRAARVRIATRGRSPVIADTTNLGDGAVELTLVPSALSLVAPAR